MKKKEKNTGEIIDDLFSIIKERKKIRKKGSYTSFLFNKGMNKIAQKVSEETAETIIEAIQVKKKISSSRKLWPIISFNSYVGKARGKS